MLIRAYAKVNLGLAVTNKRADGFHDIDTIFSLIDLHDLLRLEPIPNNKIYLRVKGADLPQNQANLAYRAAELYLKAARENSGVVIELEKNIPVSAGLGGGSSDAAAVLLALAKIYPSDLDLKKMALELGSDVPFFLSGFKAAHAQGQGEILSPLEIKRLNLLLLNPNIAVSAGAAYQNLAKLDNKLEILKIIKQLNSGKSPQYYNSLQPGVVGLEPKIAELLQLMGGYLDGVLMSGSGPTCFGLGSRAKIDFARAELSNIFPGYWIKEVQTL